LAPSARWPGDANKKRVLLSTAITIVTVRRRRALGMTDSGGAD